MLLRIKFCTVWYKNLCRNLIQKKKSGTAVIFILDLCNFNTNSKI